MENGQWDFPENLWYDEHYQWIRKEGDHVLFGLTHYGLEITGDILYLALPLAGDEVCRGDACGSLEAGKWVGRIYPPISGRVVRVNEEIARRPALIGQDPYECWFMELSPSRPLESKGFMTAAALRKWLEREGQDDA
ncbi:MAG TPA: glycine cleavage system protein H [Patescibacteria group bacterium]|nr:glycine cleavage system protein H [Patescibacteria group bacterium]